MSRNWQNGCFDLLPALLLTQFSVSHDSDSIEAFFAEPQQTGRIKHLIDYAVLTRTKVEFLGWSSLIFPIMKLNNFAEILETLKNNQFYARM